MSFKSTVSEQDLENWEAGNEDKFYVKLQDEGDLYESEDGAPTWRVNWLLSAFLALFWYTGSNYIAGTQKGDIYAGKVANSLCLGMFAIIYTTIMVIRGNEQFTKTITTICTLLGTKRFGDDHELWEEVPRAETLKAICVSFIWGLLNAVGITFLYIAFEDAGKHGFNISVCSAILSGNCIYALIASYTVFQDKITIFQTLGVVINLGGVLIISFGQGASGVTPLMVFGSCMSASCLGIRIILSRYCSARLDSLVFMNINFIADFLFGLVWIIISLLGWYKFNIDFYAQFIVFWGGVFAACAEIFLFLGIERGVAGAVVSIAGTNGIVVGLLNWLIQGATPFFLQIVAIALTFTGILVMSLGDIISIRFRKHFVS